MILIINKQTWRSTPFDINGLVSRTLILLSIFHTLGSEVHMTELETKRFKTIILTVELFVSTSKFNCLR